MYFRIHDKVKYIEVCDDIDEVKIREKYPDDKLLVCQTNFGMNNILYELKRFKHQ